MAKRAHRNAAVSLRLLYRAGLRKETGAISSVPEAGCDRCIFFAFGIIAWAESRSRLRFLSGSSGFLFIAMRHPFSPCACSNRLFSCGGFLAWKRVPRLRTAAGLSAGFQ